MGSSKSEFIKIEKPSPMQSDIGLVIELEYITDPVVHKKTFIFS